MALKEQKKEMANKWEVKRGRKSGKAGYYAAIPHDEVKKYYPVWGGVNPETRGGLYHRHKVNPKTHQIIAWPKHTNPQGGKREYDKIK